MESVNIVRYMTIDLVDGMTVLMKEGDIRKLYESFKLAVPNMNVPVISMELREAIIKYGVAILVEDGDYEGVVMFMLPSSISNMKYHMFSLDEYELEECEKAIEEYVNHRTLRKVKKDIRRKV